jgi:hypothetical protein
MSSMLISCLIFACVFGGAMGGMLLHRLLPEPHLGTDSKDVVKLGMGLIATMSALVLSLLVASTKGSYDTQRNELVQMSAKVVLLEPVWTGPRWLAALHYPSRVLASCRSCVSKPSVNQPYTLASRSCAAPLSPTLCSSRARLSAARNSRDLAPRSRPIFKAH